VKYTNFHALSTHNKLVLYKEILKHVWTYGIQLWGCKKQSNTGIIERLQNKVLRNIVTAPWTFGNTLKTVRIMHNKFNITQCNTTTLPTVGIMNTKPRK
jgi:hypothetical protein